VSSNGVIFIAAGEAYVLAANRAAQSVRNQTPALPIDLFTDVPSAAGDIFSEIHPITKPHARSKVNYLYKTRFDRTLYLDTDIRLVADISDIFSILDRFDIALAHAHARNREATNATWRIKLPTVFPQLNTGVIVYNSAPSVLALLREWEEAYHKAGFRKDQVTLRELLWCSDLRLYVLPPEYNVRYARYLSFWDPKEAVPRILHFHSFHEASADPEDFSGHLRGEPQSQVLKLRRLAGVIAALQRLYLKFP
jgi:hypothetical protein